MWKYSAVLMLPTLCLSALWSWTHMCTTQDKFSRAFTGSRWWSIMLTKARWLFQATHSKPLLFSSSAEIQNIKHNMPFWPGRTNWHTEKSHFGHFLFISFIPSFHFHFLSISSLSVPHIEYVAPVVGTVWNKQTFLVLRLFYEIMKTHRGSLLLAGSRE